MQGMVPDGQLITEYPCTETLYGRYVILTKDPLIDMTLAVAEVTVFYV